MLTKLTGLINRRAGAVLITSLVILALCAVYGLGVFAKLSGGGFNDPDAESTQVSTKVANEFTKEQVQMVALFSSSTLKATDPAFIAAVNSQLAIIRKQPHVVSVADYYSTGLPTLLSKNQMETYAAITMNGTEAEQDTVYKNLVAIAQSGPVEVRYGGSVAVSDQINAQVGKDLAHAESLSFPILTILLILVFGSVVAGLLPLVIGGSSIVGALFIVRLLTTVTSISVYSINVITLLGLGLAIDYSLFMISRFREELRQGKEVPEAFTATMQSAGRTVFFSATTVILSLLSLLVFPETFLKSMGLGGAAAVAMSMILALTILPAVLRLLGHKVNALPVPFFGRSLKKEETGHGFWYQFSHGVMHRPVAVFVATMAILLFLGVPFLRVHFSTTDVSSVPESLSSRQVSDALNNDFGGGNSTPIAVLVHVTGNPLSASNLALVREYEAKLKAIQGVVTIDDLEQKVGVTTLTPAESAYALASPAASQAAGLYISGSDEIINLNLQYAPQSSDAQSVVKQIRALSVPTGLQAQVGGETAQLVDLLTSLEGRIGYALLIAACATAILLFLMLGSVVIPIKAVIINFLSLTAAFGVLVWVFQDGHLANTLHLVAPGSIDATQPVLIFAIAFGLAMDYELFLLSRIKENYDQTHDNVVAVATGVQKTASIITSAAFLMVVVIGLFATSKISLLQQIGVGLAMAVFIDATVVRMLLVPATMRLMGHWNWWAPKPLARLSERLGIRE